MKISPTSQVLYFGCIKDTGHYLYESDSIYGRLSVGRTVGLNDRLMHGLDGTFCPPESSGLGCYMVSKVPPWVIVSWWDCSVDTRPNSCSTFIFQGCGDDPIELLAIAKHQYPSVFARQLKPIPYEPPQ